MTGDYIFCIGTEFLSSDSILALSSQRKLSFLFDSWLLLLSPLFDFSKFDQHEVLQMSSILKNSVAHCFEYSLIHTEPLNRILQF